MQLRYLILGVLAAIPWGLAASQASSQERDDAAIQYRSGLRAEYSAGGHTVRGTAEDVGFDWDRSPYRWQLPDQPVTATWRGQIMVRPGGTFTFRAELAGQVTVRVAETTVIDARRDQPGWVVSEPIQLGFGYYPITVQYRQTGPGAHMGLCWQSQQFPHELVPAQYFFHKAGDSENDSDDRGEELLRTARCNACHEIPLPGPALRAPSLERIRGAVHPEWLVEYLQQPKQGHADGWMPHFGLNAEESLAIASYLGTQASKARLSDTKTGDAHEGKQLVESIGCLACHRIDSAGRQSPFGGRNLSNIAAKRPTGFFERWLEDPKSLNPDHRMPVFPLSRKERRDVATYLAGLGMPGGKQEVAIDTSLVEAGRRVIQAKRCAACHHIPGVKTPKRLAWTTKEGRALPKSHCLSQPDPQHHRPGYQMREPDRLAIETFLASLNGLPPQRARWPTGDAVLQSNLCLGCHRRGSRGGLDDVLAELGLDEKAELAAMTAPSLDTVGQKQRREWLEKAVLGEAPRLRPWLTPRMPRFPLSKAESDALVDHLIRHDRLAESFEPPGTKEKDQRPGASADQQRVAAHQLVGPAGFGCMSCHAIGEYEPVGVELGARGSDLSRLDQRIRKTWFRRWMRDPARIVPGVEMPAIRLAVPGVLHSNVGQQLDALWTGLAAENLPLPAPTAVTRLAARPGDRPIVLRDIFEHPTGPPTTRAFAVALPNGHNLMIDLDRFSIRQWWMGEFAHQHTRGKTWYWQTGGVTLLDQVDGQPMLGLIQDGELLQPVAQGQDVGRIRRWEHLPNGVRLELRLRFKGGLEIPVEMIWRSAGSSGMALALSAGNVPDDYQPVFVVPVIGPVGDRAGGRLDWATPFGSATMTVRGEPAGLFRSRPAWALARAAHGDSVEVVFSASTAPPRPTPAPPAPAARQPKPLAVMPGYEVVRLPLPANPMPTGIGWLADGTMLVTSLKGGVYRALDANGDGLTDQYQRFSDYLATPFGVLVEGNDVIVSHKPELVRLRDSDGDGWAERVEVIATGWGVTFDYHDWMVGPVGDGQGNYYVSVACQQDDRPAVAAEHRGKVLRIAADGSIGTHAHGIRFGMGIAMSSSGALFTTDNQGVTNPFNELNHIRPDRHYGFFSKLEPRPKGLVTTDPAIRIPHPWTRSVNGIAFIPEGDGFGPFAGHLIGAEYDTRRLVRMSLQRVGETFQGCCYPLAEPGADAAERDETFLGPLTLAFGPDGCLYVGSIRDSGWGGGNNHGAIERVAFNGKIPFGIREVRAFPAGFDVELTGPVDPQAAADTTQYQISCYRRVHRSGYATPDSDRTGVDVTRVEVSSDGKTVRLYAKPLRAGFVYDIAIGRLGPAKETPFPDVAFYSLNEVPTAPGSRE